jgi:hypothetical protein
LKELLVIVVDLLNGALLCPEASETTSLSQKKQRLLESFNSW